MNPLAPLPEGRSSPLPVRTTTGLVRRLRPVPNCYVMPPLTLANAPPNRLAPPAGTPPTPGAQNRGYASSLVREAAGIFSAAGDTHVGLSLDRGNPAAHLFNELGFKEMFSAASL